MIGSDNFIKYLKSIYGDLVPVSDFCVYFEIILLNLFPMCFNSWLRLHRRGNIYSVHQTTCADTPLGIPLNRRIANQFMATLAMTWRCSLQKDAVVQNIPLTFHGAALVH
jgi:hypothetical protein